MKREGVTDTSARPGPEDSRNEGGGVTDTSSPPPDEESRNTNSSVTDTGSRAATGLSRNTNSIVTHTDARKLAESIRNTPRPAFYTPEHKEWDRKCRLLRAHAERTGDICYECFKELPNTVYTRSKYEQNVPVCQECATRVLAEKGLYIPEKVIVIPAKHRHEWLCAGPTCIRTVVFLDQDPPKRRRVFCSRECQRSFRKVKEKRTPQQKTCEVCGDNFTATRRDAKTCKPAGRQKAYRQRKQEEEG